LALLWNPVPIPVFNPSTGERAGGALAYFYVGGTTTPLRVFPTDALESPHPDPVPADANGVFPPIFIPYGPFGYRVTTAGGSAISPNVLTVQNPAPPDSGGGGGVVVQADQIFQTGFTMWTLGSGNLPGWVPMNGGTLGNVGSGANLRANADALNLFTFIFNNVSEAYAPVSGGRTTPSADFAANKTIVVPTMAGFVKGGLDTMGAAAANRIQQSTMISTTNASPTATVASATGLFIGMKVVSANVPAGTTVTAINGTTLTLSGNAGATASGTAARFSVFDDAQVVGAIGGGASLTLLERQLPAITPAGSIAGTVATRDPGSRTETGSTAPPQSTIFWSGDGTITNKSIAASFLGSQFGGGQPFGLIQPTRLGTDYIKL
jgi:hypothetical protein